MKLTLDSLNWTALGRNLRIAVDDAHEGRCIDPTFAYMFLLDNPDAFMGDDAEWPDDMPAEPNIELIAAYYRVGEEPIV